MELISHGDGWLLQVKVVPGSSRERIAGPYGEGLKVTVRAAPEKGAANQAVVGLLAVELGIAAAQVSVHQGRTTPHKQILIRGLEADEIRRRLQRKE